MTYPAREILENLLGPRLRAAGYRASPGPLTSEWGEVVLRWVRRVRRDRHVVELLHPHHESRDLCLVDRTEPDHPPQGGGIYIGPCSAGTYWARLDCLSIVEWQERLVQRLEELLRDAGAPTR